MQPKSTPLPGHRAPGVGFEVPLEMLAACHHRIEDQCTLLQRLVTHLAAHGSDEEASAAATAVLRYFDTAGVAHHADEEIDVFPALLRAVDGEHAARVRTLVAALQQDHRALEAHWRHLRPALLHIAAGRAQPLVADDVMPLVTLYARHMALEEAELLPLAARVLPAKTLDSVGLAMRQRRGIA